MRRVIFMLFVLSVMGIAVVHGAQPLDELKEPINQIVNILEDPEYQDAAKKAQQREKLWEVMRRIFDFKEMGKRSLATARVRSGLATLQERLMGKWVSRMASPMPPGTSS